MKILITGDISTWNIGDFSVSKINTDILNKINTSDAVIYNLEGPIGNSSTGIQSFSENPFKNNLLKKINSLFDKEQPLVFSDESILNLLKQNPRTIVTLANNHIKDLGKEGFLNTISILDGNNIGYIGGEEKDRKNSRVDISKDISVLNYNFIGKRSFLDLYGSSQETFGASSASLKVIRKEVEELKKEGKKIILILHIGKEMVEDISKWNLNMEEIRELNSGITIIHHPHMYIKTEYEKDNIFILGDFIFHRPDKFDPDRNSAILEVEQINGKLIPSLCKIAVSDIYSY